MRKLKNVVLEKKGGTTIAWVGSIPVFILFFLFLGAFIVAWLTHSSSQVAADAGSLAATDYLNRSLHKDLDKKIEERLAIEPDLNISFPNDSKLKKALLANTPWSKIPIKVKLDGLFDGDQFVIESYLENYISNHESEIASTVRDYVVKNGGDDEGKIILPKYQTIEVQARTLYQPVIWEEQFKDTYIEGDGHGPKLDYLNYLPDESITINY